MKKQFVYVGSVIILIISVLTFVVFGVGTEVFTALFANNEKLPAFGSYDGKKIEYAAGSEFAQNAANLAQNYRNQGYEINSQSEYYIFSQAFNQTLLHMACTAAVDKTGFEVPDTAINRRMLPYFYDETGKYSPRLYNQIDTATKNSMRDAIKDELYYARYTDDLLGSINKVKDTSLYGLKTPSKEADFLADMGKSKRSFNMVSFSTSDFPKEEAKKFAESHKDLFVKYDISAITVDEEKEAKTLLKDIQAGKITFEDALKEKSQKYYSDDEGKLASPYYYQIKDMLQNEEDIAVVTAIANGEMSDVIETGRGWSIFRTDGASADANLEDDAILDTVVTYMKANETGYIENYYADIAKNFKSDAAINGFEVSCEKYNVELKQVPAFPLNFGGADMFDKLPTNSVSELNNASGNENFFKTAFGLKENEISDPIVLGVNVVVLQLTGVQIDQPAEADAIKTNVETMEQNSVLATLVESDKVENNFTEVFFRNLMN